MLNLKDFNLKIINEINGAISQFLTEHQNFTVIGIYSSPVYGWISICFNKKKSLSGSSNNCPDFDFVEYHLIEIPEWQDEFESDSDIIKIKTNSFFSKKINIEEEGNEGFNKVIFKYLCNLIENEFKKYKGKIFIQMLDSEYEKSI